jgi:hypothetical protein
MKKTIKVLFTMKLIFGTLHATALVCITICITTISSLEKSDTPSSTIKKVYPDTSQEWTEKGYEFPNALLKGAKKRGGKGKR